MPDRQRRRRGSPARRDLVLIFGGALALAVLATALGAFDLLEDLPLARDHERMDEVFGALILLAIAALVFAWRRVRELRRDVVVRETAERALRESEERFRRLSEATTQAIALHEGGVILEVNEAFGRMFRMEPSDAVGRSVLELAAPGSRDLVANAVRTKPDEPYQAMGLRADRTTFRGEIVSRTLSYQGRDVRVTGIVDVTEQWEAEAALRDAESLYRSLVERIPAVTHISVPGEGAESRTLFISPQVEQMTGFAPAEWYADSHLWGRLLHPEDRDRVLERAEECVRTGRPFVEEYRLVTRDGRIVWVHEETSSVGEEGAEARMSEGIFLDVTARKLAEEALRRREAILEAVAFAAERFLTGEPWEEAMNDVLAELGVAADVSRVYIFGSRREDDEWFIDQLFEWCAPGVTPQIDNPEMQGFSFEQRGFQDWEASYLAGETVHGSVRDMSQHHRDLLSVQDILSLAIVPIFAGEEWWGIIGFDDCAMEREWSVAEIDALKAAAGALGAAIARERAEAARREAEERFRTLVEQIPAVTYVWRAESPLTEPLVLYISPQVEPMLGFSQDEWRSSPRIWLDHVHPDDRERVTAEAIRTDASGEPYQTEYRMITKDGRTLWIRDEARIVARSEDPGHAALWQGVMFDVTTWHLAEEERRGLLARIVQAQEDERGRIAGDIHDDPVQKMTAVGIRLQTLRTRVQDPAAIATLDQLEKSVALAIRRLRRLLFELRPPELEREGLASAIGRYLADEELEGGSAVSIVNRLIEEPPVETRVVAYRIAQEALANVRKHASARSVEITLEPRDGGIFVRVRDDGVGFSRQGENGGQPGHLGLSDMRQRAEMARGWWRIDAVPGRGTTVEFWLPNMLGTDLRLPV